ncbi:MAG: hypothetical protein H6739_07970 [Alphaproteobacteria bacterium]|nr:hypothetical protein [Alphaproteobacteria bacterium]
MAALRLHVRALRNVDPGTADSYQTTMQILEDRFTQAQERFESKNEQERTEALATGDAVLQDVKKTDEAIIPLLHRVPELLGHSSEGRQVLDELMQSINWKHPGPENLEMGKRALMARYGLESLDGKLGRKALPKLYELLGMVPDEHVHSNQDLLRFVRDVNNAQFLGLYEGGQKKLTIWVQRVSGPRSENKTFVQDDTVDDNCRMGNVQLPLFDHTTLHEVGHAVDHLLHFMNVHMGEDVYGGWRRETDTSMIEAFMADGFGTRFPLIPTDFLEKYLKLELENGDEGRAAQEAYQARGQLPSVGDIVRTESVREAAEELSKYRTEGVPDDSTRKDHFKKYWGYTSSDANALATGDNAKFIRELLTEVLKLILHQQTDPIPAAQTVLARLQAYRTVTPDWNALAQDTVARICNNIHTYTGRAMWRDGRAAAEASFLNGRVYSVDHDGTYFSYAMAARRKMVSNYQFNAPSEWFAELYALYYANKLPPNHPARVWLDRDVAHTVAQARRT